MGKTCFVISSIGEENSETRKKADSKYDNIFEPVLKKCGYYTTRADKISKPGSISKDIVEQIMKSDLVIADVTDENPNVFYELAIRNAIKKPVVVFRKVGQTMPFDIYDTRAIPIDNDNSKWKNSKKTLGLYIEELEKDPSLASNSILSDFSFEFDSKTGEHSGEISNMYYILRDIQQQIFNISKSMNIKSPTRDENKISSVPHEYLVSITPGSSVPGCHETQDCFDSSLLTIKKGETVLWINDDSAAHTVTSGTPGGGPDGIFDSSMFLSGNTFSHTFYDLGEFPYFDMVHPWMIGVVIVEE